MVSELLRNFFSGLLVHHLGIILELIFSMSNEGNRLLKVVLTSNLFGLALREMDSWVSNDRRNATVQANAGMDDHQAPFSYLLDGNGTECGKVCVLA